MISTDKHCELLAASIREKIATIYSSFRLFVQLYSAIVGGAAGLSLGIQKVPFAFAPLADTLTVVVAITCIIMIIDAHLSWHRFRKQLSKVAGKKGTLLIPPPTLIRSRWTVATMLLVIIVAVGVFIIFNPLRNF